MSDGNTATPPTAMQRSKASASGAVAARSLTRPPNDAPPDDDPPVPREIRASSRRPEIRRAGAGSGRRRSLARAHLERDQRHAGRRLAPAAGSRRARRPRRTARRPARTARSPARSSASASTYGRFASTASHRPSTPSSRSACTSSTSSPSRSRVRAGHRQRVRAHVDPDHPQIRPLVLQRQRDRAAAGADVDDARAGRQRQPHLDQQLGLGPRDQHPRVDRQRDPPELLAPEDVSDRLARRAARDQRPRSARERVAADRLPRVDQSRSRPTPSACGSSSSASSRGVSQPAARSVAVASPSASRRDAGLSASPPAPRACGASHRPGAPR